MVMIELLVIIQMRIAASRARRGVVVRRTAKKNIQGGMTIRLKGPRSRQNERHEERKGKEKEKKRERARWPEGRKKERTAAAGPLSPFSRLVEEAWMFVGA